MLFIEDCQVPWINNERVIFEWIKPSVHLEIGWGLLLMSLIAVFSDIKKRWLDLVGSVGDVLNGKPVHSF